MIIELWPRPILTSLLNSSSLKPVLVVKQFLREDALLPWKVDFFSSIASNIVLDVFSGVEAVPNSYCWFFIFTSLLLADLVCLKSNSSSSSCYSDCVILRKDSSVGSDCSITVKFAEILPVFCGRIPVPRRCRMLPSRIDLREVLFCCFFAGVVIILCMNCSLNCISLFDFVSFSEDRTRCFEACVAEAIRINLSGLVESRCDLCCFNFLSESFNSMAIAELSSETCYSFCNIFNEDRINQLR